MHKISEIWYPDTNFNRMLSACLYREYLSTINFCFDNTRLSFMEVNWILQHSIWCKKTDLSVNEFEKIICSLWIEENVYISNFFQNTICSRHNYTENDKEIDILRKIVSNYVYGYNTILISFLAKSRIIHR